MQNRPPRIRTLIQIAILLLFCLPLTVQAKSACGDSDCYGCCIDNCDALSLKQEDLPTKNLALAIKSCKRGCSIIHWTGSSMSGKINQKQAQKSLSKACRDKEVPYPDYCMSTISLWGQNCGKKKPPSKQDTTRKDDIDRKFNELERSTRIDIARELISRAFPSLAPPVIAKLMQRSDIMRGINFGTLTTPLRMAQDLQQVINRIKSVEKIIPVNKLDTIDAIAAEIQSEVVAATTTTASNKSNTSKNIARPSADPSVDKYKGLPPDKVSAMLQKELESVMALLTKPGASKAELRIAVNKLLGIYDELEKEVKDPQVKQQIAMMKNTLKQVSNGL